jgi:hypothetical protein
MMDAWADDLDALDHSQVIPEPSSIALLLMVALGMNCRGTKRAACDMI